MIDPDQPRNYHRQQVLYALQQGGEPMTAWEVHEGMTRWPWPWAISGSVQRSHLRRWPASCVACSARPPSALLDTYRLVRPACCPTIV